MYRPYFNRLTSFLNTSLWNSVEHDKHLILFTHVPRYKSWISLDCLVFTSDCSIALNKIRFSSWTSCCCSSSLLVQPKLSVRRLVEHAFWSKCSSSPKSRCNSMGITRSLDPVVDGIRPSSTGPRLNRFSLNGTQLLGNNNLVF